MNKIDFVIRRETPADYAVVENLTREAFWNVHVPGCSEHYFVHMMRDHADFLPELALVAEKDGTIIANVMYTRAQLVDEKGEEKKILTFGPVSVHPDFQRMGCSRAILEHSFGIARELGYDTIVIFGNPSNYVSRGFVSAQKHNICLEGGVFPFALLVKELTPGALDGRRWYYRESTAGQCCEDEEAVARFDAQFPTKEKAWRPSQEEFYIHCRSTVSS